MQVLEEGWSVHVRLFGDWATCMHGDDDTSWLEVASAAAFGQAGVMWGREMLHTGRTALGRALMACAEDAAVHGGLADTHEILLEVLYSMYTRHWRGLWPAVRVAWLRLLAIVALNTANDWPVLLSLQSCHDLRP